MKNTIKQFNKAFTLAEVLITLVIVGVVAAMTIPTLVARYEEQTTVAKVQKTYSTIAQAWEKFQADNGCTGTVEGCFDIDDKLSSQDNFIDRFLQYVSYVQKVPTFTSLSDADWLPDKAYNLDGSEITVNWMGIYKRATSEYTTFFTLADGTICKIQIPDGGRKSGFIFFDTNGKKGPNRIGKDQFPIGIGAYNNPDYEGAVNPFYAEDDAPTYDKGLCAIRNNNTCNPDVCTQLSCSPTAYVLKNKKLPPITW